jgi:hypothetical protein
MNVEEKSGVFERPNPNTAEPLPRFTRTFRNGGGERFF